MTMTIKQLEKKVDTVTEATILQQEEIKLLHKSLKLTDTKIRKIIQILKGG